MPLWTARAERPWMAKSDFPQLTVFPAQARCSSNATDKDTIAP